MRSLRRTSVARLRLELGLSVEAFAALINKSVPTIYSLESGRLALSQQTAQAISRVTGANIYWLLEGKGKPRFNSKTMEEIPDLEAIVENLIKGLRLMRASDPEKFYGTPNETLLLRLESAMESYLKSTGRK